MIKSQHQKYLINLSINTKSILITDNLIDIFIIKAKNDEKSAEQIFICNYWPKMSLV